MNPLMLLAQAFLNYQSKQEGESLKQAGLRAAEVGRRLALAGVFFATSGLLVFSSVLIAVIEMGLQLESSGSVSYSGLMISATTLLGIAVFTALTGWIIGSNEKAEERKSKLNLEDDPRSELRTLLETIAVGLLREFLAARERKAATSSDGDSERESSRVES